MTFSYEIGQPSPIDLDLGMFCSLLPTDRGLDLTLLIGLEAPSRKERRALTQGEAKIAILPASQLLFVVAKFQGFTLDAPMALSLEPEPEAILRAADKIKDWPDHQSAPVKIVVGNIETLEIKAMRAVPLPKAWWVKLARSYRALPRDLSEDAYQTALGDAYERWPHPDDMLKAKGVYSTAIPAL
tara:strand:+ start:8203 stop:8757 length:555 start_codon:yes stop_codon:yes gene_type:complete